MSRILRFFALVAVVLFSVNAFAGDPYGSCSAKKVYKECNEGYVLQNGECVLKSSGSCSDGQYWNGSACQECTRGYYCTGDGNATKCPPTHPNSVAGASSISECFKSAELMKNGGNGTCFGKTGVNDGSITCYYGSTCALPSWNASSCNMTNGSKIFKGWSLSDNATTGTTGDFVHDNTYYAVWVTPSCNITNGTGVATTASSNKPRCNVTCNSGYGTSGTYTGSAGATSVSYTCTLASNTCSAGQYWDGSACQECTSGYYCPGGTWTGTLVQGLESCPDGYGNSAPGSVDVSDCYLTTTAGKYVETPESAETTCAENGYCPGGIDVSYGDTDGRMTCTANSTSAPGSDEISDCKCNAGYGGNAGVANGTCTICVAGTYKTDSGNSSCSACTAGYYCTGGANQTACAANSSSAPGSDAISDCKCNAGYGGDAGVTNGTCTICAAGTYKTSSGNTSCSTCTAGYYCTGGANQTACTANSSSGAGSDAISDCKCNAGYGGDAGVTNGTCTICAAGTYKTSSGNSSCSTCTEGYYCTGGTNNQTACPTGYGNSAPGSDVQSDCYMVVPAGSYLRNPGDTSPSGCLKGSSTGEHEVYYGNVSQCSSCAPGSYTPYAGASCSVCPPGSYCTGDGNAKRCPALYPNSSAGAVAATDCYTNTLTGQYIATPRAEVVTDCQAGTRAGAHTVYYGDTSQCLVCKTNQWSGDAAGSCQACPSGWANDGATAADHAYESSCKHTVQAGSWYNSDNSTFDTCADGTYSEAHLAGYGVSTSCESCSTGYTNNTDHTACVAIKYTVKYNANGGTGGTTASSSHQYGVAKTLTANGFTRTGYTFAGWATSSSGGVEYTNQQSVTNLASTQGATVNLYAQWTANTYTVKYNANGGSGTTASSSHEYGVAKTLTPNGFTRTGYTFAGWAVGSSSGDVVYTNQQSVTNLTSTQGATVNLYAKWTANTYTVQYNANGGSGTTASSSHEYGVAKALTANGFSRTGYTFAGWATSPSGAVVYTNQQSVTNLASTQGATVNLYAKWTANTYTVQYNANGGSGTTASSSHEYGVAKALTANGFTRTGYTFAGWATSASGDVVYTNQQSVTNLTGTQGATVNLYAKWTAGNYSITLYPYPYNTEGTRTLYTTYDTNVYLDSNRSQAMTTSANNITKPTQTGYTFAGYYSESGGTGTEYIDANGYITSAGLSAGKECASTSCRWYVKWVQDCYQITLDNTTNGGTGGTTVLYKPYSSNLWYSDNSCSTEVTTLPNKPTKTNAAYFGHYTDASSGSPLINISGILGAWDVTGPTTLYAWYLCDANWRGSGTEISGTCTGNQIRIRFNANGGTGGQTDDVTATYDSQMPTISTTPPTRTGYTFNGWYDAQTGGTQYYTATGTSARTCDKTATTWLHAQWTANTYTVSFDANGGTGGQTAGVIATYGSQMPTISTTPPTRTGYTFNGWYDAETGGTQYYTAAGASARPWNKTENTTLYARWTAKTYTCSSGQYLNVTSCETCTAGYYCPSSSVTYTYNGSVQGRTACGSGKYSEAGSDASSDCKKISAGCYGTSASSSCPAVCAVNTYSNAGASSCSSCPTDYKNSGDTAASHAGSASCIITVSGGYYIGTAGDNSSNWDKCACGTYKASHTVAYGSTSSCATTDAGYYAAAGASSQTKATAGYYAAAGACSQTACSGRTKYSAAGAASCSTVSTGYYTTGCNSSSNACTSQTICAKGTYCSSGVAYNCPGGTYGSTTGLSTNACSGKCTAGYYCPAGSTSATQNACATNATSAAGSDAISDCVCKAGYSGDASTSSGTCTACACGYYKGSTGNTSCTKTTAGYYATGTGNTGQTKATAGNYAAAGACSQSSCADLGGGLYSESGEGSDATDDCYATVPATKYLSSTTSTSFTTCTAGYYCPGKTLYYASIGGRTGCGSGKYSEEGSDASSDCKEISAGCYGTSASSACPNTCPSGSYSTGGTAGCMICNNKPTNSSYTDATGNTSADCPWTCDEGYNQTSDNQCGQFCTAGITHIKLSNGLSVPLYSSARTSPAINVQVNNSVCYGSLETGQSSGALNVKVGSTTYHTIN